MGKCGLGVTVLRISKRVRRRNVGSTQEERGDGYLRLMHAAATAGTVLAAIGGRLVRAGGRRVPGHRIVSLAGRLNRLRLILFVAGQLESGDRLRLGRRATLPAVAAETM